MGKTKKRGTLDPALRGEIVTPSEIAPLDHV